MLARPPAFNEAPITNSGAATPRGRQDAGGEEVFEGGDIVRRSERGEENWIK
jgi:hypothetical protein